jgi:selenide,water dikinase
VGTGIITTAVKRGLAGSDAIAEVMRIMAALNRLAAEIMDDFTVNACTDVTGFGLIGHLKEMVCGSGVRAILNADKVPVPSAAWEYAAAGCIPGGTKNNLDYVKAFVQWSDGIPELMKYILADAQTSGGLLISLPADHAKAMLERMHNAGINEAAIIGRVEAGVPGITV